MASISYVDIIRNKCIVEFLYYIIEFKLKNGLLHCLYIFYIMVVPL